jgi:hypothetical protein
LRAITTDGDLPEDLPFILTSGVSSSEELMVAMSWVIGLYRGVKVE